MVINLDKMTIYVLLLCYIISTRKNSKSNLITSIPVLPIGLEPKRPTLTEMEILGALLENEALRGSGMTVRELSRSLDIIYSHVSRTLKALEKRGMIKKQRGKGNRVIYTLDEASEAIYVGCSVAMAKYIERGCREAIDEIMRNEKLSPEQKEVAARYFNARVVNELPKFLKETFDSVIKEQRTKVTSLAMPSQ